VISAALSTFAYRLPTQSLWVIVMTGYAFEQAHP